MFMLIFIFTFVLIDIKMKVVEAFYDLNDLQMCVMM